MKNSPTTMNIDMILEILSHCPGKEMARFRLLNKECNKRSYGFGFLNSHLERTNSFFGYIIITHSCCKYLYRFVSGVQEQAPGISLDFLPSRNVRIQACDTNHGILLCVHDDKFIRGYRVAPDYIICKPATKQYEIISNPKTRYFTVAAGLMVIQSNPFRYKIVRLSQPLPRDRRKMKEGFYNTNCEVFDSDSSKWRRLNDLELPRDTFIRSSVSDKPVSAYGCLHWIMTNNTVLRFCMRTETWSTFPVPGNLEYRELVSYEGKLGVIGGTWRSREVDNLWVLENSLGNSWTIVKDVKHTGGGDVLWFPSNDVVSTAWNYQLGLYNMNSNKVRHVHKNMYSLSDSVRGNCFPFYSNYDRVALNEDRVRRSNGNIKDWKLKKILNEPSHVDASIA